MTTIGLDVFGNFAVALFGSWLVLKNIPATKPKPRYAPERVVPNPLPVPPMDIIPRIDYPKVERVSLPRQLALRRDMQLDDGAPPRATFRSQSGAIATVAQGLASQ